MNYQYKIYLSLNQLRSDYKLLTCQFSTPHRPSTVSGASLDRYAGPCRHPGISCRHSRRPISRRIASQSRRWFVDLFYVRYRQYRDYHYSICFPCFVATGKTFLDRLGSKCFSLPGLFAWFLRYFAEYLKDIVGRWKVRLKWIFLGRFWPFMRWMSRHFHCHWLWKVMALLEQSLDSGFRRIYTKIDEQISQNVGNAMRIFHEWQHQMPAWHSVGIWMHYNCTEVCLQGIVNMFLGD